MKKKIINREDGKSYLIRYTVFTCKFFAIKIHHILLSDYDCLHDHPWSFISIILLGGYFEKTFLNKKWYRPGSVLFRRAKFIHALELPENKTAWTLVVTFRKTRQWGFWTRNGFIEWFKYSNQQNCQ